MELKLTLDLLAIGLASYAIFDVRRHFGKFIEAQRQIAVQRATINIVDIFTVSEDRDPLRSEVMKESVAYLVFSQIDQPKLSMEAAHEAILKEGLAAANTIVERGTAKWGDNFDVEIIKSILREHANSKNEVRVARLLGRNIREELYGPESFLERIKKQFK